MITLILLTKYYTQFTYIDSNKVLVKRHLYPFEYIYSLTELKYWKAIHEVWRVGKFSIVSGVFWNSILQVCLGKSTSMVAFYSFIYYELFFE